MADILELEGSRGCAGGGDRENNEMLDHDKASER
jgi:hypothetical protein